MYTQDSVTNCGIHTLAIYKMYSLGGNFLIFQKLHFFLPQNL